MDYFSVGALGATLARETELKCELSRNRSIDDELTAMWSAIDYGGTALQVRYVRECAEARRTDLRGGRQEARKGGL